MYCVTARGFKCQSFDIATNEECSMLVSFKCSEGNFPFCSKLPAPRRSLKTFPRIAGYRIFKTLFLRKSNLTSLSETIRIHVLGKSHREVQVWGRRAFFQTGLGQLVRPKYVSSFYSYPKNYPPRIHRRESVSWLSFSRTMWIWNFAWLRHCT